MLVSLLVKRKQVFLVPTRRTPQKGQVRRSAETQGLKMQSPQLQLHLWDLQWRCASTAGAARLNTPWWKSEASHFCSRGWLQARWDDISGRLKRVGVFHPRPRLQFKQSKSHPVSLLPAVGPPLFIKPGQIQLACGLTPNLMNLLSFENLHSPCQYLISPAADKISWRYSMGFFSLQLWLLIPASSAKAIVARSYFPTWNRMATPRPMERAGTNVDGALARVTGRADSPYQGWPTKAACPGD